MQNFQTKEIVNALKAGKLVALPSETVYGLAAHALNEDAVLKIFKVKGRPFIDPLIVHVYSLEQVEQLAFVPKILEKLAERFWPGPLTVILHKKPIVPDVVTAGLNTVAIRMPKHPIFREILKESQLPLAAPSANPFGYLSPTEAKHVEKTLGDKVKYIIDGGPCPIGIESTILNLSNPEQPEILRPGPITDRDIEDALGIRPVAISKPKSTHKEGQVAPGLLDSHYSPKTPLSLFQKDPPNKERCAVIYLKRPQNEEKEKEVQRFWLSEDGDLDEIARNLFSLLERLDGQGYECLYVEQPDNEGLGIAINDRLKRAAHK